MRVCLKFTSLLLSTRRDQRRSVFPKRLAEISIHQIFPPRVKLFLFRGRDFVGIFGGEMNEAAQPSVHTAAFIFHLCLRSRGKSVTTKAAISRKLRPSANKLRPSANFDDTSKTRRRLCETWPGGIEVSHARGIQFARILFCGDGPLSHTRGSAAVPLLIGHFLIRREGFLSRSSSP